ncbi:protein of unknown function [Cupriavidus taiwanensis]|nr:protein of unknown function [Cupriavidus taiwanensis]
MHARAQFARAEGLAQVVVGTELQPEHAVGLVAMRGKHDHRALRARAVLPQQVQAVAVGQHQVEQRDVVVVAGEQGLALRAGVRQRDGAVIRLQVFTQHLRQFQVVVDQQHARGRRVRAHQHAACRGPGGQGAGRQPPVPSRNVKKTKAFQSDWLAICIPDSNMRMIVICIQRGK